MMWVEFANLVVLGFVACAELGSVLFVHPVIRGLAERPWIEFEQGLLRTFGRVMPIGMFLISVLSIVTAISVADAGQPVRVAGAVLVAASIVTTVIVNVPINIATGRWDAAHPPADWRRIRARWERFQAIRGWLQVAGFVCFAFAAVQ